MDGRKAVREEGREEGRKDSICKPHTKQNKNKTKIAKIQIYLYLFRGCNPKSPMYS